LIDANNRNASNLINHHGPNQGTQVAWLLPAIGLGVGAWGVYQNWNKIKDFWNNLKKTPEERKQWGKEQLQEEGRPAIEGLRRLQRGAEQGILKRQHDQNEMMRNLDDPTNPMH